MTDAATPAAGIVIRRAEAADAPDLARFGAASFRDTYGPTLGGEPLEAYIAETYDAERQAQEIADPDAAVLIAEHEGAVVGFAFLRFGTQPVSGTFDYPAELARLYVSKAMHGRGVAQTLMRAVRSTALDRGASTLWLAVWPANARAVAFYTKEGFARAGMQPFRLGDEIQLDDVLAQPLT